MNNHLLIIEDDRGSRPYVLKQSVYSIGRDPKCDIRLASLFASRHHATLVQQLNDDGSYYYRIIDGDLEGRPSANGLIINGHKLQTHDLQNEDEVVFGPQVQFTYYFLKRDGIITVPPDEFDIDRFEGGGLAPIGVRPWRPQDPAPLSAEAEEDDDRTIP